MYKVETDPHSGFCPGVIRVVGKAEEYLARQGRLLSLGAIVHNEEELERLEKLGLRTMDDSWFDEVSDAGGESLLVRAHGEPPSFYGEAARKGFRVIDCTCPVVLKLQKDIREAYARSSVLIFGKIGHAEVLGLVGQTDGNALVVESMEGLDKLLDCGKINTSSTLEVFSQTTMSPSGYRLVCRHLEEVFKSSGGRLTIHDTICRQVSLRHSELKEFSLSHDVIVFVSGMSSSNGKVLFDLCRSFNLRSFHISGVDGLRREWFRADDKVGICGATSTPKWLLEDAASRVEGMLGTLPVGEGDENLQ